MDHPYKTPLVFTAAKSLLNPFLTKAFDKCRPSLNRAAATKAVSLNPSPFHFPSFCLSRYSSLRTPLTHCIFWMTQARSSAQLQNRLQPFPVTNWPPKNHINQVFFLSRHHPVKQWASFGSYPYWKSINHWHICSLGIFLGKSKFPLWNPVENSLLLTEHLQGLTHHFLWPIQLSPFSPSVCGSSSCKPLLSSCPLLKHPQIENPSQVLHTGSWFLDSTCQQGQAGKERENLFWEGTLRGHSNRLSTSASGWTLRRDLKPPRGQMHAKTLHPGKHLPWFKTELCTSSFRIPSLSSLCSPNHCKSADRPFMHIFSSRNGNKSKTNTGLLTDVCCLIAKVAEKFLFLLVAFSFYPLWKISPWQENWKWHKNVKLNNEGEKIQRERWVCLVSSSTLTPIIRILRKKAPLLESLLIPLKPR